MPATWIRLLPVPSPAAFSWSARSGSALLTANAASLAACSACGEEGVSAAPFGSSTFLRANLGRGELVSGPGPFRRCQRQSAVIRWRDSAGCAMASIVSSMCHICPFRRNAREIIWLHAQADDARQPGGLLRQSRAIGVVEGFQRLAANGRRLQRDQRTSSFVSAWRGRVIRQCWSMIGGSEMSHEWHIDVPSWSKCGRSTDGLSWIFAG